MSRCNFMISRILLVLILCWAAWPTAAADSADPNARRNDKSQIQGLMRQGERLAALPLCRLYTTAYPADAAMLYNLACLENTTGDYERAATALRAAIAAGFMDFDLAGSDPDLQGTHRSDLRAIISTERERLAKLALSRGLALDFGTWSEARDLIPHGEPVQIGATALSHPQLRLRWHGAGLEFELTADSAWEPVISQAAAPPWRGGPGLAVTLGVPDGTAGWDLTNHFLFVFGMGSKGGVGGMYVPSQKQFQNVHELAPKVRVDAEGHLRLTASIPWQVLAPYNPVIDTPLGINATVYFEGPDRLHRASLLETGDTLTPSTARRRFARLEFRTDSIEDDLFLGKLDSSLSSDHPLGVELVAISTVAGTGTLSLNFIDQAGRSILPEGPMRGPITLVKGTNHISRQADFSSLTTGGYVMQAELAFPSGRTLTWGGTVLQLADGWQEDLAERISYVALTEQKTTRYLLDTIKQSVNEHQVRRSPGAIVTTMIDLDQMLADAADNGSILPEKGSFVFVYPGPAGQDRVCRLYLPAGRKIADGLNPIIVLSPGAGQEGRLAARIGLNYEQGKQKPTLKTGNDDRFPVYLVPELPRDPNQPGTDLRAEVEACRRWAMNYFVSPAVSLVGLDALGAIALDFAGQVPHELNGLLILAGRDLNPWPQAQPEFIRQKLGPGPADLPITWIDFQNETKNAGQAREILQALKDLGYQISDEQAVHGSLNLTQSADRLVLWAESLR